MKTITNCVMRSLGEFKRNFFTKFILLLLFCTRATAETYPNFCSGSTLDISTVLPSGKTYTCVPRSSNTVSGAAPQNILAATIIQTLTIINSNSATSSIIFDVKDNTDKNYVLTVTLLQTPKLNTNSWSVTSSGCGTINSQLTSTTVVTVPTNGWSWSRPDTLGAQKITSNTAIINDKLINYTSAVQTIPYTVSMTGTNGCKSQQILTYLISPTPKISDPSRYDTICSGTTISFTPKTQLSGSYFTWINPSTANISGGTTATTDLKFTDFKQTLYNETSNSINTIYNIYPAYVYTGFTCTGPAFQELITINPRPNIQNKDTIVCPGIPFSMNPSPLPFITNYTWDSPIFSVPNSILGGSSQKVEVPNFSQLLTNTTNSIDVSANYNVTPSFGECVGKSFSIVVTVKASPYITDTLFSTVCSENAFNVTLPLNLPKGSMFKWEEPVYTNGISGGSLQANLQNTISQILKNTNSDTTTGIALYNVTPVANGCQGQRFPVKVYVKTNSAILESPLILPSICSGTNLNYIPKSNFANTAFTWVRDSIEGISNSSSSGYADINEKIINTTGEPISVNYRFSLYYNGCKNEKEQVVSVIINPNPILTSSLNPISICSEGIFNYTPVSNTRDVSFSWTRSFVAGISQQLSSGINSISEKLTNTTYNIIRVPYEYTLTAYGCVNKQTVYEIVNPVLTLEDQIYSVCSGNNFKITPPNEVNAVFLWSKPFLSNGLIGGNENSILPSSSINDNITNSTDTSSYALYQLTPIIPGAASGGCLGNSFKVKIIVNPIPTLSSPNNLPSICSGTPFKYIPTSKTPNTNFTWIREATYGISNGSNKGNGIINETLIDTLTNSIDIQYKIYATFNGCTDSTQYVKFTLNPSPIIKDQSLTICSGKAFQLPVDLEPAGTTYTWSNTSIVPANTVTNTNGKSIPQLQVFDTLFNISNDISTVFYTVTPINSTCPLQSFKLIVKVNPISNIGDQAINICSNTPMSFKPTNVPAQTTYKWGFIEKNPSYFLSGYNSNDSTYQNAVTQNLTNSGDSAVSSTYLVQTDTKGCVGAPFNLKVIVYPLPKLRISGPDQICTNTIDTLNLSFTGYSPWTINYVDNKDNTLTQRSGFDDRNSLFLLPNLPKDSVYKINIMNISDRYCSRSYDNQSNILSFTQKINPLPLDSIIAPNGNLICIGQYQSMYIKPMAKYYKWFRNDTLIQNATSVNYDAFIDGTYYAHVTDSVGCSARTLNEITMIDLKKFKISFSNDSINCINNLKLFLNLSDTSLIRNISWKWDFNGEDTKFGYNSTFNFKNPGLKRITLAATVPSCTYSISKDSLILIQAPKRGMILERQSTNAYKPIQLNARSFEGIDVRYNWEPGLGLNFFNIGNPIFSYYQTQTYYIKMKFPEGCITTDTLRVNVFDSQITDIFIPRSFTPNGDGVNDKLFPYIAGIKNFIVLRIYNKYGRVLFETKNISDGWDGKYKNTDQPMDNYLWEATGIDFNGKTVQRNGNFILIR